MRSAANRALAILGLFICTSLLGFQAAPALVLYYKFDEAVGNTAVDSSGNGFNGTWTPSNGTITASAVADCAPNVLGNTRSIIFGRPTNNMTNGAYVNTPSNAAFTFTGAFSAMAWIKPVAIVAGQNANDTAAIVQKWDYSTQQLSGWAFNRNLGGQINFITGSLTQTDQLVGTQVTAPGVWTHVAVVYDGTNKTIFVNGVQDATRATTIVPAPSPAALHVGKDDYNRNYIGNVDEVKLYGGALTAGQVMSIYQGVDAPTNLTATAGAGEATLNWTTVPAATSYNILRGTTTGGPYTQIGTATTNTYLDLTATFGSTYYYVVQAVVGTLTSINSNEAFCTPTKPQILFNPTAIMVAENGGIATFTVTLVTRPISTVQITLAVADPTALRINGPGGVAGPTATLTFLNNQALTQTVTVTGIERYVQGPNLVVLISCTAVTSTDPLYPPGANFRPRPVTCTIIQDVAGLVINPAAGLATVNGGPAITFTVSLATIPAGSVILNLSVDDPNLATVAPVQITTAAWNNPVTVTVTPLNADTNTTFVHPYNININSSASGDVGYAALGNTLVPISTNTSTPPLEHLWKCGLLGMEGLLPLGILALWRRRQQARKSR